jgi:glycosyltransferase involved in cell wall biosynthesis
MKIIFLDFDDIKNPLLGAGQARATVEVGSRLADMGHSVISLCSRYPNSHDRVENGITYTHIGWGTSNIRINNIGYLLSIPYAVMRLHADIIIECFTAPCSSLFSPLFTRIPVVALPSVFAAESFAKKYHLPLQMIEAIGCKLYKYFMPYIQSDLDKMKKYNSNIIFRMIGQGVGKEYIALKQQKPKHILYLGRYDMAQKGIDLLIEAYATVSKEMPYPLVIAGHGQDELKIKNLITQFHMEKKISMIGGAYGKKKMELLAHALYVAMPSRYDNLPLFSLEALASGLPLITFATEEFSWLKSEFSLQATPFDAVEYGDKMLALTKSPKLDAMRKNARTYTKQFTWESIAEQMEDFFQFILKKEAGK